MPENANKSHTSEAVAVFSSLHLSAASLIILYFTCAIAYLTAEKLGENSVCAEKPGGKV